MMNNFEKMVETMMEKYMEQMMAKTMEKMFSSMMPQVAPAEAVPAKQETMSLEAFLAMDTSNEVAEKPTKTTTNIEFDVVNFTPKNGRKSRMGLKYNQYVGKAVWTYNHINIKSKYPNIKYSNGCYYAETTSELQNFAGSYHIVTKLDDAQMAEVRKYWDSKKSN